ncbi:MAG TPA: polysaccharide deacetylase family protein, partial [Solirubrobacteraceae bacterium]|nr:polysaccharide deacetylase family protein [Solirubrobacteraceae bacterium]
MAISSRPRSVAGRLAPLLPEPLLDRARLAAARRLELRARRSPAVRGAALVLHAVAPHGGDPLLEVDPPLAVARLDEIVGHLTRSYALVHAGALPGAARSRRAGEPLPVALTFDDDLASHLAHAAPVLRRHGAVATAFLCGADGPFWWQLLQAAVDERAIDARALPGIEPQLVAGALERRPRAIHGLAKAIEDLAPAERDAVAGALAQATPTRPPVLGRDGARALADAGWEIGFHTRRHHV